MVGGSGLWWAVLIGSGWQSLVVGESAVGWWVAMTGLRWVVSDLSSGWLVILAVNFPFTMSNAA